MDTIRDNPDLLSRLAAVQQELVIRTHQMARAASALQGLPRGRTPTETAGIILRTACEQLGFERAYAYLADGDDVELRCAWPQGARAAGPLERQVITGNAPVASRSGRTLVVPLASAGGVRGALRFEGRAARTVAGDAIAPVMRFAEAAAMALDNAVLAERVRSQGSEIESLASRLIEANHRIKNNLQALAGFLGQHGGGAGASKQAHALRAGVGRILAIAALHEALACGDDEHPDLGALTERISASTAAVDQAGERIAVIVEADSVRAAVGPCRAYALVLHELVSNSLQHAYPESMRGQVRVRLRRTGRGAVLTVADDGVGLNVSRGDDGQFGHTGLGLGIASAIVENELAGRLELASERGTTATLEFPLAPAP